MGLDVLGVRRQCVWSVLECVAVYFIVLQCIHIAFTCPPAAQQSDPRSHIVVA